MPRFLVPSILALILFSSTALAENWPQWRGPTGNGLSNETGIATEWSQTKNVAWRLPLPGPAGATPVVWGEKIFLSTAIGGEDGADLALMCVSTDGKKQWQVTVGNGNQRAREVEGNSASPTPVTDGKHVWVFFGTGSTGLLHRGRRSGLGIQCPGPVRPVRHSVRPLFHACAQRGQPVPAIAAWRHARRRVSGPEGRQTEMPPRGRPLWAVDRAPEPGITSVEMRETKTLPTRRR